MKFVLGKKQTIKNEDWLEAVKEIEQWISKEEVNTLEEKVIEEITHTTCGKKAAYAWSGGKDSIVLGHICEKAGITDCMIGVCDLEYPAFFDWIIKNQPKKLEIINSGQNLTWLKKHKNMLFPSSSMIAGRWYSMVQHKAQAKYFNQHQLDLLLTGRRTADGNYVGRNGIYTNAQGITRYSPIASWSHEAVLGYIHYNKLSLPPIYNWKDGYKQGTHPWAARICKEEQQGWQEVYDIDKTIVEKAAEELEGARAFLEGLK